MTLDSSSTAEEDNSAEITKYEHMYDGERCVFCNVNVYDNDLYKDGELCEVTEGRPMKWTYGSVMGSPLTVCGIGRTSAETGRLRMS
jgi:hypothetical protein